MPIKGRFYLTEVLNFLKETPIENLSDEEINSFLDNLNLKYDKVFSIF